MPLMAKNAKKNAQRKSFPFTARIVEVDIPSGVANAVEKVGRFGNDFVLRLHVKSNQPSRFALARIEACKNQTFSAKNRRVRTKPIQGPVGRINVELPIAVLDVVPYADQSLEEFVHNFVSVADVVVRIRDFNPPVACRNIISTSFSLKDVHSLTVVDRPYAAIFEIVRRKFSFESGRRLERHRLAHISAHKR